MGFGGRGASFFLLMWDMGPVRGQWVMVRSLVLGKTGG